MKRPIPTTLTLTNAIKSKGNVMIAVMLRDIRTRSFNHGLGFLIVPLWPLAHLSILLAIYSAAGRASPYGTLRQFLGTGLIPTLSFIYVSRYMALSLLMNKPLLAFPVVKIIDVSLARAALEIIGTFMMISAATIMLYSLGDDVIPFDPVECTFALAATILLGVGVGILSSIIALLWPFYATLYTLITVIIYLLSGSIFLVSSLPENFIYWLSWNPIVHCVEWMRMGYFQGYPSQVVDKVYVLGWGAGSLFLGLALERFMRRRLME